MLNLMIVDDEEHIRQGIDKILSKYSGELRVVGLHANGLEALVHISGMQPDELDVIITDIEMPVMDGLSFIEQAKRKMPNVFAIILTGYNDFEYARQSLRVGAADYLLKPMDKNELFRLLNRCEQGKKGEGEGRGGPVQAAADASTGENGVVEKIRKLLEKEYNRELDLKYIANKIGYNASYISKVFSREAGETITDYMNRIRLKKAKQFLLDHPDLKVYEIAHLSGYPDKIYFQKLFKKTVGLTPREYREHKLGYLDFAEES